MVAVSGINQPADRVIATPAFVSGISVVVTTYDRKQLLIETLRSIVCQTLPVDEIIVVNDGGSREIDAIARGIDERIFCVHQDNLGMQAARNTGVMHCRHEWVVFSDDDDLWMPDRCEHIKELIGIVPVDIVATDFSMFTDKETLIDSFLSKHQQRNPEFWKNLIRIENQQFAWFPRVDPIEILIESPFWGALLAVRKTAVEAIGGWDQGVRGIPSEDLDFVYRIVRDRSVGLIMKPTVRYRVHSGNVSHNNTRKFLGRIDIASRLMTKSSDPIERKRIAQFMVEGLRSVLWAQINAGDTTAALVTAKRLGIRNLRLKNMLRLALTLPVYIARRHFGVRW